MPNEANILKTVGQRIKHLRGEMTHMEFADMLGVSPQAVSDWENAKRMPRIGVIEKLSEQFNVPKSYILGECDIEITVSKADAKIIPSETPNETLKNPLKEPPKTIPIIDSTPLHSGESEELTPEEIIELARQMEFTIQYVKNKCANKKII